MTVLLTNGKSEDLGKVSTTRQTRLVLRPKKMQQAFLLVPEDSVPNPYNFLVKVCEEKTETSNSLTLGKLFGLLRESIHGNSMPEKLRL